MVKEERGASESRPDVVSRESISCVQITPTNKLFKQKQGAGASSPSALVPIHLKVRTALHYLRTGRVELSRQRYTVRTIILHLQYVPGPSEFLKVFSVVATTFPAWDLDRSCRQHNYAGQEVLYSEVCVPH